MNDRRLSDDQLARALRAYLPERPEAGLHGRITAVVEVTRQRRALPRPFDGLVEADPIDRRRALLLAAALLVALTFATAAIVGALLDHRRDSIPELIRQPQVLKLEPPADLDAYMTSAYAGLVDLPALKIVMADGDVFYHDGSGTVRQDRRTDSDPGWTMLYSPSRAIEVQHGAQPPIWIIHPAADVDPRAVIFREWACCGVDPACDTGWTYVGLEYVLGRPAHHVACGQHRWMDVELGIPLRAAGEGWGSPDPGPSTTPPDDADGTVAPSPAPLFAEVVELEVGPQPAALFAENPDGLQVMTADEFTCSQDDSCKPPPGVSRPSDGPPRAEVHGEPPADLAAFVAAVHASYSHLPALEMIVDSYSYPPSPESRSRHVWDGLDSSRDDTLRDGTWVVDWLRTGGRAYEHFGGWHDYGPGSATDPPDWDFDLPDDCSQGWEHLGFDIVVGRAAHHLVCGPDEFWIDTGSMLVVRAQHEPTPTEPRTSIVEVVELRFRPQPAELFIPPVGAVCPRCASPSPAGSHGTP